MEGCSGCYSMIWSMATTHDWAFGWISVQVSISRPSGMHTCFFLRYWWTLSSYYFLLHLICWNVPKFSKLSRAESNRNTVLLLLWLSLFHFAYVCVCVFDSWATLPHCCARLLCISALWFLVSVLIVCVYPVGYCIFPIQQKHHSYQ